MVEVGELQVVGTMDTREIDSGFNKVTNDFKGMEQQAGQTNASLKKMKGLGVGVAASFLALGGAGLTAIMGLATRSPVLAGTMAKIEVNTMKLSNTVGRQLKPVFDSFANNLLPSLNQFFLDNSDSIAKMSNNLSGLIDVASKIINSGPVKGLMKVLGFLDNPFGMGETVFGDAEQRQLSNTKLADSPIGRLFSGEGLKPIGQWGMYDHDGNSSTAMTYQSNPIGGVRQGIDFGMDKIGDLFGWISDQIGRVTKKDKEIANADGVTR